MKYKVLSKLVMEYERNKMDIQMTMSYIKANKKDRRLKWLVDRDQKLVEVWKESNREIREKLEELGVKF